MKMLYQIEKSTKNKRFQKKKKIGCFREYNYLKIDKIAICERNIVSNEWSLIIN